MTVKFATLLDVIEHRAQTHADAPLYGFLGDDDALAAPRFGDLVARGRAVAAALQRIAEPGARVLLLLPSGLDVIETVRQRALRDRGIALHTEVEIIGED